MKLSTLIICLFVLNSNFAQVPTEQELPYQQIKEYPDNYGPGNIISRMIDGLGFRYHWASKNLLDTDLAYQPSKDGKTTLETLEHIHALSLTILNACQNKANIRPTEPNKIDYQTLRENTLNNLNNASNLCLNKSAEDLSKLKVIFQRGNNKNEFEFWHNINGPIADAIYHTGQIVAFRRASGNPIQSGVNVFMGTVRE